MGNDVGHRQRIGAMVSKERNWLFKPGNES